MQKTISELSLYLMGIKSKAEELDMMNLKFKPIAKNLELCDISDLLNPLFLANTSAGIIRVSGKIHPHIHFQSNSVGTIINNRGQLPFPKKSEVFFEMKWVKLTSNSLLIFNKGSVHGLRGMSRSKPLYILFLDSFPVNDKTDHIEIKIK